MDSPKTTGLLTDALEEYSKVSSLGIFWTDVKGQFMRLNRTLLSMVGQSTENEVFKAYGKSVFNLFRENQMLKKLFEEIQPNGTSVLQHVNLIHKGNKSIAVSLLLERINLKQDLIIGYVSRSMNHRLSSSGEEEQTSGPVQEGTEPFSKGNRQITILDNIPYLTWLKDGDGKYITVNKPFADFFSIPPGQIIGKTDREIFPEDIALRHENYDREIKDHGKRLLREDNWGD
ncbi:MAG: PAS domain-containing protein, partial [Bacteroidales bacterium]